jgi:hypothetical protein
MLAVKKGENTVVATVLADPVYYGPDPDPTF